MLRRLNELLKEIWNRLWAYSKRVIEALMPFFGMKIKAFYDKEDFPWLQILEDNAEAIRSEMLAVYNNNMIPSVQDVNKNVSTYTTDDRWKTFVLWVYGNRIDKNCMLCPQTEAVIKQIPGYYTAFYSILEAGKSIDRHRGVYRGNTLAHLGLVVPEPISVCTFHVGKEKKHWEQGKAFAFEDSYYHYVTNDAKTFRAVLIVEFRREVPSILKPLDNYIQRKIRESYITKNILKKLKN